MGHSYNSLFFVTIAAFLSPWLSVHLFRNWLPSVVLEILIGYLIGPHVANIAITTSDINFLAAFGFSYLMFLSGLELDFGLLSAPTQPGTGKPWIRGTLFFLATLLISYGLALLLYRIGLVHDIFVGTLLLSTTSMGIVLPALKESFWISAEFGQEVLQYAIIADILTLILFTGFVAFHTTGNGLSVLLILVLLLFFVVVYRLLRIAMHRDVFRFVENASNEFGMRGAFALILAFLAFSQTVGAEVVIGAFLAGAIISLLSDKHSALTQKLNSVGYGFLIPIFFVNVGMKFDVGSLASSPLFVFGMVAAFVGMYANKVLPALWFLRRFSLRQRFAGGLVLSSRLSLVIAASQIGQQIGILSPTMSNGFILLAILTCLVSPSVFTRTIQKVPLPEEVVRIMEPSALTIDAKSLPPGWKTAQIEVTSRNVTEMPMRALRLPPDILFINVQRADEHIIPRGHTRLEQFDIVVVMGSPESIAAITHRFGKLLEE